MVAVVMAAAVVPAPRALRVSSGGAEDARVRWRRESEPDIIAAR
jgi:hypothetical protein